MPRVLLADDEPAMRRRVKALLDDLGCEVTEAEDGRAAIEALAAGSFDLIVTDLRMPEADGLEVLDGLLNGKGFLGKREPTDIRAAAALALGRIAGPEARAVLERATQDDDPVVRSNVNRALRNEA